MKLKPAKAYLRMYYLIQDEVPAYQENDIMTAVSWLIALARRENKPLSICIGLGTNSGNHSGGAYISRYLDMVGTLNGTCISCAAGNESNRGCHYLGIVEANTPFVEVELRVGEEDGGFSMELWGIAPEIYSVGFVSPGGEVVERISPRLGNTQRYNLVLEPTVISVSQKIVESVSGGQMIFFRFENPVPGIWRIRVYGTNLLQRHLSYVAADPWFYIGGYLFFRASAGYDGDNTCGYVGDLVSGGI